MKDLMSAEKSHSEEEVHNKLKALKGKSSVLSSRIRSYEWQAEDYDRRQGKGEFFKKYPDTKVLVNTLYDEKVKVENKITACMMASDYESKKTPEAEVGNN